MYVSQWVAEIQVFEPPPAASQGYELAGSYKGEWSWDRTQAQVHRSFIAIVQFLNL